MTTKTYFKANDVTKSKKHTVTLDNGLRIELSRSEGGGVMGEHPVTGETFCYGQVSSVRKQLAKWEADKAEEHDETLFAYIRVSTNSQSTDSQSKEIGEMYPKAQLHVEHGVSGKVPAKERPELKRLLDKLRRGDTLVVWWVDRLGRDYYDVESVMRELLDKGISIKTVNQGLTFAYTGNEMQDMTTNIQITMLTAMAAAERKNRLASAEAGRQALRQKPEEWAAKFKGRTADKELHQRILEELGLPGSSIRKVAQTLGCNASTVQRVKKKYQEAGHVA